MLDLSRIRAITLDLDDTLWPVWPTIHRAEQVLSDWLMQHAPATAALSIAFCLAAVAVVHTEVARHAAADHGRWCTMFDLTADLSGMEQANGMEGVQNAIDTYNANAIPADVGPGTLPPDEKPEGTPGRSGTRPTAAVNLRISSNLRADAR